MAQDRLSLCSWGGCVLSPSPEAPQPLCLETVGLSSEGEAPWALPGSPVVGPSRLAVDSQPPGVSCVSCAVELCGAVVLCLLGSSGGLLRGPQVPRCWSGPFLWVCSVFRVAELLGTC